MMGSRFRIMHVACPIASVSGLMPVSISDEVADQKRLKRDEEEASTAVELAIFTFYQGSLLSMLRFLVC